MCCLSQRDLPEQDVFLGPYWMGDNFPISLIFQGFGECFKDVGDTPASLNGDNSLDLDQKWMFEFRA